MAAEPWLAMDPAASSSPFLYAPPDLRVARPYELSHGARAAALSQMAGTDLARWQLDVQNDWAAVDDAGQFLHRRCGASIPRQAGKSSVAISWVVYLAAELGMAVLYTAHNYSTTCEMRRRFQRVFGRKPHDPTAENPRFNALVRACENKTAQEAIFLRNGGRIHFSTRTKTSALGYSFDAIVYDEAQELTTEQMQAISAAMSSGAARNPQELFIGTPRRPGSFGNVFAEMRAEAHGSPDDDLSWWEWGSKEVGDITDESRWMLVNPSLSGGVANVDAIRLNCRKFSKLGDEGVLAFAQEFMGYWLPGKTADPPEVDPAAWAALACAEPPREGKAVLAFKFSPDGSRAAVAACRRAQGGRPHVEGIAVRPMSGGMAALVEFARQRAGTYAGFVIDGGGNAQDMNERLLDGGVTGRAVERPVTRDVAAACAGLLSGIVDGSFTHFAQPGLDAAVCSVRKRPIGRAGFGFEAADPSAALLAEAAALALWGIEKVKRDPTRKLRVG